MNDTPEIQPPQLAGVIGHPIGHSKSPRLHGYWLRNYKIRGYYIPMSVRPADLADAFKTLPKLGFRGLNVTLPHKIAALQLADTSTDRAALIGTDGYGFIQNLHQNAPGWQPKDGPAVVIGAGGAARAVVAALLGEGVPKILLSNRTRQRSEILAEDFGARVEVIDWNRSADAMDGAATIVNATALYPDRNPVSGGGARARAASGRWPGDAAASGRAGF